MKGVLESLGTSRQGDWSVRSRKAQVYEFGPPGSRAQGWQVTWFRVLGLGALV